MSAAETLRAARASGVMVDVDGDDLLLEAFEPPPTAVLEMLSRDKASIVALLRPRGASWTAKEWLAYFDERVTIAIRDWDLSRVDAEARAFDCCVCEWSNRRPICSSPDHCCWCGGTEREGNVLLPFGMEPAGHAWLHSACWQPWYAGRKADAIAALAAMGIAVSAVVSKQFR
jgi:hypothetical protein